MPSNGVAYILQAQISFWKVLLGFVAQCTLPSLVPLTINFANQVFLPYKRFSVVAIE